MLSSKYQIKSVRVEDLKTDDNIFFAGNDPDVVQVIEISTGSYWPGGKYWQIVFNKPIRVISDGKECADCTTLAFKPGQKLQVVTNYKPATDGQ